MTEPQLPSPAELYESFYGPCIFRPHAELLVEVAAPRPGERVLDVACGTGIVARRVASIVGAGGKVVAIDLNPAMLEVARRLPAPGGAAIEWREGDAVTADLPAREFDLVLCQHGLQFFSDRAAALRRLRGALRPGGRIAIGTWQGLERQTLFADFTEVEHRHLAPLGVTHDDLVAPFSLGEADELRGLLEGAGFTRVDVVPRSFEARFPSPGTFARNMETAYGAVIPAFVDDPAAFAAYLDAVERESKHIVERYTRGDEVVAPMPTNLTTGYAA